jgi:HAD superfamily hydrolase (TIGR01549 family)
MKALLFDFSQTLFFSKNRVDQRTLNTQHRGHSTSQDYSVFDYFEFNQELLDFAGSLKDQYQLYIFTSGTMATEVPELRDYLTDFKKVYSGSQMGLSKQHPDSYKAVAKDIGLPPAEIVFIDDSQANCDAAQEAGLKTIRYTSNEEVMRKLSLL